MNCPYGHLIKHDDPGPCWQCSLEEERETKRREEWERDRPARIAAGEECPECGTTNGFDLDHTYAFGSKTYYCANCGEDWEPFTTASPADGETKTEGQKGN